MMGATFVDFERATRDAALLAGLLIWFCLSADSIAAQPTESSAGSDRHVIELAGFLEAAEIYAGIGYAPLTVFPIRLRSDDVLPGSWLTMDDALASGRLVILEKGDGGQVPLVQVENQSRTDHVLMMSGELLSGGKQTRTVRQDVIVAPGQRVDVPVLCVEKRRWGGEPKFEAGQMLLPQAIHRALRQGADQDRIWGEVTRNNAALRAENPTDSLHAALGDPQIRDRVRVAGQRILPDVPRDSVGFLFVVGDRAAGAELFGCRALSTGLLPKLIDSYMVDVIVQGPGRPGIESDRHQRAAIEFFERIRRAASSYANTPGAGDGIRTRTPELLGEGVGLDRRLVHFGIQPAAMPVRQSRPDSR
jgi:hypothetical protein